MTWSQAEETRIATIESLLIRLQTTATNLAEKEQLHHLLQIKQEEITTLQQKVTTLERLVSLLEGTL